MKPSKHRSPQAIHRPPIRIPTITMLPAVALFDRKNPLLTVGVDVPWNDSYCRMTAQDGRRCDIADALCDARLTTHAAREVVQVYVAVLLKTPGGAPLGTLSHYDLHAVTPPPGVFEDLDAVCPVVERTVWAMLKLAHVRGRAVAMEADPSASKSQPSRLPRPPRAKYQR